MAAAALDVGSAGARRSWRGAGCAQLAPEVVWVPSRCENLEVRGQKALFLRGHPRRAAFGGFGGAAERVEPQHEWGEVLV